MKLQETQYIVTFPNPKDGGWKAFDPIPESVEVEIADGQSEPILVTLDHVKNHMYERCTYLARVKESGERLKLVWDAGEWVAELVRPRPIDLVVAVFARTPVQLKDLRPFVGDASSLSRRRLAIMLGMLLGNAVLMTMLTVFGIALFLPGEPLRAVYWCGLALALMLFLWNVWLPQHDLVDGDRHGMRYLRVHLVLAGIGLVVVVIGLGYYLHLWLEALT